MIPSLKWRDDDRVIQVSDVRLEGALENGVPAGAVAEIRIIDTTKDKETVGYMDPDELIGFHAWASAMLKQRTLSRRMHRL